MPQRDSALLCEKCDPADGFHLSTIGLALIERPLKNCKALFFLYSFLFFTQRDLSATISRNSKFPLTARPQPNKTQTISVYASLQLVIGLNQTKLKQRHSKSEQQSPIKQLKYLNKPFLVHDSKFTLLLQFLIISHRKLQTANLCLPISSTYDPVSEDSQPFLDIRNMSCSRRQDLHLSFTCDWNWFGLIQIQRDAIPSPYEENQEVNRTPAQKRWDEAQMSGLPILRANEADRSLLTTCLIGGSSLYRFPIAFYFYGKTYANNIIK